MSRTDEIDNAILVLFASIQRIQLLNPDQALAALQPACIEQIACSGLNLLTTVVEYLSLAVWHFRRGLLGYHYNFFV
jgi:hypothetical protein